MTSFYDVLQKYSSSNNLNGTDKITTHSYGDVYENILQQLKRRPDVKILEIGVMTGAFLQALHEFLPDAQLYGIDVDLNRYRYPRNLPYIQLYERDGTTKETAHTVGQDFKFDLIIEDGSHSIISQISTLDAFAPFVKPNGWYVTEDIVGGNEKHKTDLETLGRKHNLLMEWVDLVNVKKRFDDILAVFTPN
jgi:predicted O-methyltransferase YrrM